MPWPQAISKITSGPSKFLGLKDRGLLKAGMYADIVILDPGKVSDTSTYTNPYKAPIGINYVITNGKISVYEGQLTRIYGGRILSL